MPSIRRDKQEQTSEKKPAQEGMIGMERKGGGCGTEGGASGGGRKNRIALEYPWSLATGTSPPPCLGARSKKFCCRVFVLIGSDDVAECLQVTGVVLVICVQATPPLVALCSQGEMVRK